jgi:hypothetical protein
MDASHIDMSGTRTGWLDASEAGNCSANIAQPFEHLIMTWEIGGVACSVRNANDSF